MSPVSSIESVLRSEVLTSITRRNDYKKEKPTFIWSPDCCSKTDFLTIVNLCFNVEVKFEIKQNQGTLINVRSVCKTKI